MEQHHQQQLLHYDNNNNNLKSFVWLNCYSYVFCALTSFLYSRLKNMNRLFTSVHFIRGEAVSEMSTATCALLKR